MPITSHTLLSPNDLQAQRRAGRMLGSAAQPTEVRRVVLFRPPGTAACLDARLVTSL